LAIFHSHPSLFPSRHNTSPSPPSSQHAHPPCLLLPHCSRHQQPPASSLSSHGVLPFSPSATAARRPLLLLPHAAAAGAPFSSSLVSTATSRELGFFSMALPPCRSPAASPWPALPILPPRRAPLRTSPAGNASSLRAEASPWTRPLLVSMGLQHLLSLARSHGWHPSMAGAQQQ
jgi:hypothetical protein